MGLYHSDHRALQERFDTVRLADRLEKVKVLDHIADDDRGFIEARDMFFIATTDASGRGSATLEAADSVAPHYPEAQFVVRVAVREVFPNCPRYIHKLALVERSKFVPRTGVQTPVPGWKQTDWARDVLPASDPARKT